MTEYISKRLRYFNQQFLTEPDFTDEQKYHRARRHGHNRTFISRGIAEGLEVVVDDGNAVVEVHPGIAFDVEGRQIVLAQKRILDTTQISSPGEVEVYVIIEYDEVATDLQTTSVQEYTRWDEQPIVDFSQPGPGIDPSPDQILLARLTISPSGQVSIPDPEPESVERTYASVVNIGDDVVTDPNLANNAVSSAKIAEADGTTGQDTNTGAGVKTGHLQNNAVNSAKIADNAISSAKVWEADGTSGQNTNTGRGIKTGHFQDNSVSESKIADNAISSVKVWEADGTSGQNTNTGRGIKTGHLQDNSVSESKIANNAISSAKVWEADGTSGQNTNAGRGIKTNHLQNDSVSSAKIAAADGTSGQDTNTGAGIKTGHLQDSSVSESKIQDNAVTADKLGRNSVRRSNLAISLVENGYIEDLGPGTSTNELVEKSASSLKTIYMPTVGIYETSGVNGTAKIEPNIRYYQKSGEPDVDVYIRFVNRGDSTVSFFWNVYTFAE